jgi:hypothetical protein
MKKFYELYLEGTVLLDAIYQYIDDWHNGDYEEDIEEYLGLTEEQYFRWVERDIL